MVFVVIEWNEDTEILQSWIFIYQKMKLLYTQQVGCGVSDLGYKVS